MKTLISAILSIYLKEMLMHSYFYEDAEAEDLASVIFHVFIMLSFVMALFGAFLADSVIGKYRSADARLFSIEFF